jgi:predicted dithiol-disulfide oxidoreductase (DUF899 family)
MTTAKHSVRFPGESAAYRGARNELLDAEIELRRNIETVAALRRQLPPGGPVPEDYVFEELGEGNVPRKVRLSELFSSGPAVPDTLILYSFMYGPQMPEPCFACTSMLDALDGEAPHIIRRANLAVIAKSPIDRIMQFARGRGWRNLRLLSSANCDYNHDYQGETATGDQLPSLNVFVRRDGAIHHTYNSELLFAPAEPGQDGRHVDSIWPLWNVLDFTPDGRGEKWYPSLLYEKPIGIGRG